MDKQTRDLVIQQISQACKDVGFFYLTGHGVEHATLNQIVTAAKNFFALPLGTKNTINIHKCPSLSGYSETSILNFFSGPLTCFPESMYSAFTTCTFAGSCMDGMGWMDGVIFT